MTTPHVHHRAPTSPDWPGVGGRRLVIAVIIPFLSAALAFAATLIWPDLSTPAAVMLGIILLAAGYWALEPISTIGTALLAIALCVACLGIPAHFKHAWVQGPGVNVRGWAQFIAPAGAPIMLLMLGSLAMASAASRTGMDRAVGAWLVRRAAGKPSRLIPGLLCVSAFVSMWTSNTAAGAMMVAVTRPLWSRTAKLPTLAPAAVMAVCIGANVGGVATPVGSPPCAIAFAALDSAGSPVTFLGWMAVGVPLMLLLMAVGFVAIRLFMPVNPAEHAGAMLDDSAGGPGPASHPPAPRWAIRTTAAVFLLTVALWITSAWTKLPVEAIALLPLAVLTPIGVLRARDMRDMEWDVMLLILSGLVLGTGLADTGLAAWTVAKLPFDAMGAAALCALMATLALLLSAFMSNTATANLLMPIGIAVASAAGSAGSPEVRAVAVPMAMSIAMGSGISMMLPVASPANAIAYSATNAVTARHFLIVGTILGLAGVGAMSLVAILMR